MIELLFGTNTDRDSTVVSADTTPISIFEDNGIDYATGTTFLNGATLSAAEMNKTFRELGVSDKASLICVVKADAA